MNHLLLLLLLLLLATATAAWASSDFVNEKITRVISANHPNAVKTTLAFKISAAASKPANAPYTILLPGQDMGGRIARMACTVETSSAQVAQITKVAEHPSKIELAVALPDGFQSGTVTCTFIRVAALSPLPSEILQTERQRMVFEADFVKQLTPYATKEEITTLALPNKPTALLQPLPEECVVASQGGGKITCTNVKSTASEETERFRVQFESNQVYAAFTSVEREIELSHWGNAAVEEHFDLKNVGAKLKGAFSRVDHRLGNYIQQVNSYFPREAFGAYYRDALGNVTSSHLRKEKTRQVLEAKLRFPVYGGWHIEWYQGYQVPIQTLVSKQEGAGRYVVELDAFHSIPLRADRLVLHVVMPAGARDFKFETPAGAEISEFRRYTYLDVPWSARRVVRIELADVLGGDYVEAGTLPRTAAGDKVRIHYRYDEALVVEKPLAVSAAILAVMLTWMGVGRMTSKR